MRKLIKRVGICFFVVLLIAVVGLVRDRQVLKESLIRFHVVANSNSQADQAVKLQVRDAVLASIQEDLASVADVEDAKQYLRENLTKIEAVANSVLEHSGLQERVSVSLRQEAFDLREYNTFRLPAGIYEALRIVIGEGEGENWWCVTFPGFCVSATTADFSEEAVEAGLSEELTKTLAKDDGYEVRFFLLDVLGKIEKSFR